jgi:soluble lytic murein transglycosylase-like protein
MSLPARLRRRLVWLAAGATIVTTPARADLWVHVDEHGKSHFATEQVDARYRLFYKGRTNLDLPPAPAPVPADFEGAGEIIRNRVTGHPNVAKFAPLIERHASANGLDPALVKAVVAVESAYDPAAVSPKGAVGLMQVIPATGERYGLTPDRKRSVEQKLLDPATNVRVGTRYLADLLKLFDNDLALALAGYNAGEGAVLRHERRVPPYPETRAYVTLVQQFRDWYAPPLPPKAAQRPDRVVVPRRRGP